MRLELLENLLWLFKDVCVLEGTLFYYYGYPSEQHCEVGIIIQMPYEKLRLRENEQSWAVSLYMLWLSIAFFSREVFK